MKFPPSPEYLARKAAEEAKTRVFPRVVVAQDEQGGVYDKTVRLYLEDDPDRAVLSFGGPCEYSLGGQYGLKHHAGRLCIDGQGLNHRGVPNVRISAEDMAEILAWARKEG